MTNRFHRVAVLLGGPSAEREVSLRSGAAVARALRQAGYEVSECDPTETDLALPAGVEAVFVALHGTFGEDGTVQAMLRDRGIPYTGAGPEASRLAFDKVATKRRLMEWGLPTPAFECLRPGTLRSLDLPVMVKPIRQGSSIGLFAATTEDEWDAAVAGASRYGDEILVEAFVDGDELTVGIVGDEVLPVLEIRAPNGRYDYDAKYTSGKTQYLVPAPLDPDVARISPAWPGAAPMPPAAAGCPASTFASPRTESPSCSKSIPSPDLPRPASSPRPPPPPASIFPLFAVASWNRLRYSSRGPRSVDFPRKKGGENSLSCLYLVGLTGVESRCGMTIRS